jgi:hypothetical protein
MQDRSQRWLSTGEIASRGFDIHRERERRGYATLLVKLLVPVHLFSLTMILIMHTAS